MPDIEKSVRAFGRSRYRQKPRSRTPVALFDQAGSRALTARRRTVEARYLSLLREALDVDMDLR